MKLIDLILLFSMLFFHLLDDFKLQGILINMKQRSWWEKNAPDDLYKNDYIIALIEHAFSWTFMIHIPVILYHIHFGIFLPIHYYLLVFLLNWILHIITDHLKANEHAINLVADQLIHIIQIVAAWGFYAYFDI